MPLTARADSAVLAALDEYGRLSQADLGRRLGLDRNDINAVVNRLQAGRYVKRVPDADRRRNKIGVTSLGQAHRVDLLTRASLAQDDPLKALLAAERRQLHALLEKILTAHAQQSA
ncbi:MarR family transcriptional regulator [Glaciibacter flavus]|uniref:MarR family transcriptional regulator n=1 Tax=Orlajensenia flava TaxID=2565934 RepID=A0A4S4FUD0_9MICO|nr:helix-turn-helix domain-containing protein [Glaciibacter flavus]THG34044.1 MarR family transcriptional regulator [Glaciibacter flavus]